MSWVAVICLTILTLYFGSLVYHQPIAVRYGDDLSTCSAATRTGLFLFEGAKVTIRTRQLSLSALR